MVILRCSVVHVWLPTECCFAILLECMSSALLEDFAKVFISYHH